MLPVLLPSHSPFSLSLSLSLVARLSNLAQEGLHALHRHCHG